MKYYGNYQTVTMIEATQVEGQFDADIYLEALRADMYTSSPDIDKTNIRNTNKKPKPGKGLSRGNKDADFSHPSDRRSSVRHPEQYRSKSPFPHFYRGNGPRCQNERVANPKSK